MRVATIVLGYDGSDDARAALDAAIDHLAPQGVLHVVTVLDERTMEGLRCLWHTRPGAEIDPAAVLRGYQREVALLLGLRGITHRCHLLEGDAASTVVDLATSLDADLVVVGAHGHGGARPASRGGVAHRVAVDAPNGLMIVRPATGRRAPVAASGTARADSASIGSEADR